MDHVNKIYDVAKLSSHEIALFDSEKIIVFLSVGILEYNSSQLPISSYTLMVKYALVMQINKLVRMHPG